MTDTPTSLPLSRISDRTQQVHHLATLTPSELAHHLNRLHPSSHLAIRLHITHHMPNDPAALRVLDALDRRKQ